MKRMVNISEEHVPVENRGSEDEQRKEDKGDEVDRDDKGSKEKVLGIDIEKMV